MSETNLQLVHWQAVKGEVHTKKIGYIFYNIKLITFFSYILNINNFLQKNTNGKTFNEMSSDESTSTQFSIVSNQDGNKTKIKSHKSEQWGTYKHTICFVSFIF